MPISSKCIIIIITYAERVVLPWYLNQIWTAACSHGGEEQSHRWTKEDTCGVVQCIIFL